MSNSLGNSGGRLYSFGSQPVLIDCNFIVDSTNGNGYGIRSLKGQGVRNVYMATSASFTGTSHTGTNILDSIASTANLMVGMHIAGNGIPANTTITAVQSSVAITVSNNTTTGHAAEHITYTGVGNPLALVAGANAGANAGQTAAAGLIWVQLDNNYNRYLGGFSGFVSPTTGNAISIASGANLTIGSPYIVASVGAGPKGAATIAPVADSSGSLAGTWFTLPDGYGQVFTVYYIVNGVGAAPKVPGTILVPINLATNASADTITTALSTALVALPSTVTGVYSFTCSGGGGATLTYTSTLTQPLPGPAQDSATLPTGSTFAVTVSDTNLQDWQAVGLPKGLTPTVGQSFVASATGAGASTGTAIAVGTSGISVIEICGDPNQSLAPMPQGGSPNTGGWILVQCLAPTPTTVDSVPLVAVTPMVPTAPANNSVVGMCFYVDARNSPSNISARA
jgi:hypothetical protein